jgi:hypothetical protein
MRRYWLGLTLSAGVFLAGLAGCGERKQEAPASSSNGSSANAAAGKGLDVSYVGPHFIAALVVQPGRIAKSPLLAPLLKLEAAQAVIKQMGVDPADVRQITVLVPAPVKRKSGGGMDRPGIVIQFAKPVDAKQLLKRFFAMVEPGSAPDLIPVTIEGNQCYHPFGSPWQLACAPNDRTILLYAEPNLPRLLAAPNGKGPLADRLRGVSAESDVALAFVLDQVGEEVKKDYDKGRRGAPPEMVDLLEIPVLLKGGTITLDLTGETLLSAVLDANDAEASARVERLAKKGQAMAATALAGLRQEMPPKWSDMLAPVLVIADQGVKGVGVSRNEERLTVTLKRPEGLDETFSKLPKMIAQAEETTAAKMRRLDNLKQIGLAMLNHESAFRTFPAAASCDKSGKPLLSWRVALLPFLDETALYKEFRLDEPWDSPNNLPLVKTMPKVFQTSGRPNDGRTSIMVFTGDKVPFKLGRKPSMGSIFDGASNTILAVEAGPDKAVEWTKPEDLPFDPEKPAAALGKIPADGFLAVFFDGSMHRLKVDTETLKRLIMHADNLPVKVPD